MSTSKYLEAYPPDYYDLFERISTEQQPIHLTCATYQEAYNLRTSLYRFLQALEASPAHQAQAKRYRASCILSLPHKTAPNSNTLVLKPLATDKFSDLIQAALKRHPQIVVDSAPPSPTEAPAQDMDSTLATLGYSPNEPPNEPSEPQEPPPDESSPQK